MQEIGEVIEIKDDNQVLVRVQRQESCKGCKACSLGREDSKFIDLIVDNTLKAKVGDDIYLNMDTPDVLKAAAIAYVFPLVMMLTFTLVSYYVIFPENQLISSILGIVGAAISFLIIRLNENKIKSNGKFLPKMISIVREDGLL